MAFAARENLEFSQDFLDLRGGASEAKNDSFLSHFWLKNESKIWPFLARSWSEPERFLPGGGLSPSGNQFGRGLGAAPSQTPARDL